jgi:phosphomannomutase/phosphoglucomutase
MRLRRAGKSEKTGKANAKPNKPDRVPGIARFWAFSVAGVAVVLLGAVVTLAVVWMHRERDFGTAQAARTASLIASDLGNRVAVQRELLQRWTSDNALREALRSGKAQDRRVAEEMVAARVPSALRVRLTEKDLQGPEAMDAYGLSYAGLDLVQQAVRQREVTPLEIHLLGQEGVHLAIAAPVLDERGSEALGVVHVAFPFSLLSSPSKAGGEGVRVLLQQRAGDKVATLEPDKGRVVETAAADADADVNGTRLRVVASAVGGGVSPDGNELLVAGITYATLLALMAAVLWLPQQALKSVLEKDHATLVALVEGALKNEPLQRVRCRLAETEPVLEVLGRLLRGVRPGVAKAPGSSTTEETSGDEAGAEKPSPPPGGGLVAGTPKRAPARVAGQAGPEVPEAIFRAYDIRGVVGLDLTPDLMQGIGRAVAAEAADAGDKMVFLARDTRPTGGGLAEALAAGLRAGGCDVIDLGVVPTPVLYFATRYQGDTSGVMVTGSHNPAEYNGLKVVISGNTLEGAGIGGLRERVLTGAFTSGSGTYRQADLVAEYVDRVEKDVAIARTMKVVVDCGNAAASGVAVELYQALGCDLVELNCDPSAGFPDGEVPDPSRPGSMENLRQAVLSEAADIGFAFDGDGDRLGVVDSAGEVVSTDRVLMLLAADVLSRHPGMDVIFDVKCSHHLASEILRSGGRPVMWKSGHAPLKAKLRETEALLAGEWSGHIIFQERWYGFDDALYAGARLLEVLALDPRPSAEIFAALPASAYSTPELFVALPEGESAEIMDMVLAQADQLKGVEVQTIDGLRAEVGRAWGLVRASNTQPALVFRFEAEDQQGMDGIQDLMRGLLGQVAPDLELPF